MAPVRFNAHSCKFCRGIAFYSRMFEDDPKRNSKDKIADRALPDFTINDLQNGDRNDCKLCQWIMDDGCVTIEDVVHEGDNIADKELRETLLQLVLVATPVVPSPAKTLRQLLQENPDEYQSCCLFLDLFAKKMDLRRLRAFGLWNLSTEKLVCRTMNAFHIQCQGGNPAANFVHSRPIELAPASLRTMGKISTWLRRCREEHGKGCPNFSTQYMPAWLIEVSDSAGMDCLRLRPSSEVPCSPYISLSYCWGGDQHMKSTTSKMEIWMKEIPGERLPQTLQDAIIICRALRLRFLWVDALCIIQDDEISKAQQISQMPQIYKYSCITIIAASADNASQGFLAERTEPNSGTLAFDLPYHCPDDRIGTVTLFQMKTPSDPVDSRAWTLQERLLSPRVVEFSHYQVRWVCLQAVDEQDWTDGYMMPDESFDRQQFLPPGIYSHVFGVPLALDRRANAHGTLKRYSKLDWYTLIKEYTNRSLTNVEDRILALSGLANEYSVFMDDTYLAGLWSKSLFSELLWFVTGPKQAAPSKFQGPSWSWTSVNGGIAFKDILRTNNNNFRAAPELGHIAEIVECKALPVQDDAPFGAVEEVASRLVIKARLLPALLMAPQQSKRTSEVESEDVVLLMKMNDFTGTHELKVSLDTSDIRDKYPSIARMSTPLTLLELESFFVPSGQQWNVKGLVLRGEAKPAGLLQTALKNRMAERAKLNGRSDSDSISTTTTINGPIIASSQGHADGYSAAELAMLRYQFRRHLGDKVSDWTDAEVQKYAEDKGMLRKLLLNPRYDSTTNVRERNEHVFYRVGMFEYTPLFRHKSDNEQKAQGECDWFRYCVPQEIIIL